MAAGKRRHVAVLGAGIQGCCIALELAHRGHRVDLYDRCAAPATQAAYWNEGKIHLGLVYANDPTGQTHGRMLEGAMRFEALLTRWLQGPIASRSTPFYYAVHKGSLLDVPDVERHFGAVAARYAHMRRRSGCAYFDAGDGPVFTRLDRDASDALFAPDGIAAAYRTAERAVNPAVIAGQLRAAVAAEPRIEFCGDSEITGVTRNGAAGLVVAGRRAGTPLRTTYGDVVNALWSGRLKIDGSFGVRYARPWLYRHKLGVRFASRAGLPAVPSTTFMLGSFGDTVSYDDGSIYLSWYPDCMIGTSSAIEPPDRMPPNEAVRSQVLRRSLDAMAQLVPALQPYASAPSLEATVGGGVIFAWGAADIDERGSELHRRYDIGVNSVDRYHSVDTGKYTMAPVFAIDACDRIEGTT